MVNEKGESLYVYDVNYLDSMHGSLRNLRVIATDKYEATKHAMNDYYFGQIIDVDNCGEPSDYDMEHLEIAT